MLFPTRLPSRPRFSHCQFEQSYACRELNSGQTWHRLLPGLAMPPCPTNALQMLDDSDNQHGSKTHGGFQSLFTAAYEDLRLVRGHSISHAQGMKNLFRHSFTLMGNVSVISAAATGSTFLFTQLAIGPSLLSAAVFSVFSISTVLSCATILQITQSEDSRRTQWPGGLERQKFLLIVHSLHVRGRWKHFLPVESPAPACICGEVHYTVVRKALLDIQRANMPIFPTRSGLPKLTLQALSIIEGALRDEQERLGAKQPLAPSPITSKELP